MGRSCSFCTFISVHALDSPRFQIKHNYVRRYLENSFQSSEVEQRAVTHSSKLFYSANPCGLDRISMQINHNLFISEEYFNPFYIRMRGL